MNNPSPHFKYTLVVLITMIIMAICAQSAMAQSATQGQQTSLVGQSTATISPGAVNITSNSAPQLPWTAMSYDFKTNQAASAPANIGGVAPGSNTGCPVVDGWSASIAVANGGNTTGRELPGCMLNILTQNIGSLRQIEVTNAATGVKSLQFDGLSVMKLETWCLYPLYQAAIENGMNFKCKSTRDAEAAQRQTAVLVTTPGVVTASNTSDPIIRNRLLHLNRQ